MWPFKEESQMHGREQRGVRVGANMGRRGWKGAQMVCKGEGGQDSQVSGAGEAGDAASTS